MPTQTLIAFDYIIVFDNESQVKSLTPDYSILQKLDLIDVVVTAPRDVLLSKVEN